MAINLLSQDHFATLLCLALAESPLEAIMHPYQYTLSEVRQPELEQLISSLQDLHRLCYDAEVYSSLINPLASVFGMVLEIRDPYKKKLALEKLAMAANVSDANYLAYLDNEFALLCNLIFEEREPSRAWQLADFTYETISPSRGGMLDTDAFGGISVLEEEVVALGYRNREQELELLRFINVVRGRDRYDGNAAWAMLIALRGPDVSEHASPITQLKENAVAARVATSTIVRFVLNCTLTKVNAEVYEVRPDEQQFTAVLPDSAFRGGVYLEGEQFPYTDDDISGSYYVYKLRNLIAEANIEGALDLLEYLSSEAIRSQVCWRREELHSLVTRTIKRKVYELMHLSAEVREEELFRWWELAYWFRVLDIKLYELSERDTISPMGAILARANAILHRAGCRILHFALNLDFGHEGFSPRIHDAIFEEMLEAYPGEQFKSDNERNLPLHLAAACYSPQILHLLCCNRVLLYYLRETDSINNGHPAQHMNHNNQLPLHEAAGYNGEVNEAEQVEAVQRLLECYPKGVSVRDIEGRYPFDCAAEGGYIERCAVLFAYSVRLASDPTLRIGRDRVMELIHHCMKSLPLIAATLLPEDSSSLRSLLGITASRLLSYRLLMIGSLSVSEFISRLPSDQKIKTLNNIAACDPEYINEERSAIAEQVRSLCLDSLFKLSPEALTLFLGGVFPATGERYKWDCVLARVMERYQGPERRTYTIEDCRKDEWQRYIASALLELQQGPGIN